MQTSIYIGAHLFNNHLLFVFEWRDRIANHNGSDKWKDDKVIFRYNTIYCQIHCNIIIELWLAKRFIVCELKLRIRPSGIEVLQTGSIARNAVVTPFYHRNAEQRKSFYISLWSPMQCQRFQFTIKLWLSFNALHRRCGSISIAVMLKLFDCQLWHATRHASLYTVYCVIYCEGQLIFGTWTCTAKKPRPEFKLNFAQLPRRLASQMPMANFFSAGIKGEKTTGERLLLSWWNAPCLTLFFAFRSCPNKHSLNIQIIKATTERRLSRQLS